MAGEPVLPDELAATVMRVDDLVQHFEEYLDPLVRGPAMELLQLIDGLHRGGLRRLADLLRAAGLQRRALDDPEARLLYDLYDLDADAPAGSTSSSSGGSFVPLARLLSKDQPRG